MPQCSLCMQIKRYTHCTYGQGEREREGEGGGKEREMLSQGVRLQMVSDLFFQSKKKENLI